MRGDLWKGGGTLGTQGCCEVGQKNKRGRGGEGTYQPTSCAEMRGRRLELKELGEV